MDSQFGAPVLKREAYRGIWKFSVTERKFLASKDYTRQIPREKPLNEARFEHLRIVTDALWFAAQKRLASDIGISGRKSKKEDADPSPRVLSRLLWCPTHERPLRAWSAYGKYLGCPECATVEAEVRPLFSKPHRTVVLRLLCERLAQLIRQDQDLVRKVISAAQTATETLQRPDPSQVESIKKGIAELTRRIEFILRNPGETEEDEKEIADTLRALRHERKELQDQLGLIDATDRKAVEIPTQERTCELLDHFGELLQCAAAGNLGEHQEAERDILATLTDGRIDMFQQGERQAMQGWLRGRFSVRLVDVLVERLTGTPVASGEEAEVVIDFKRPRKSDADADTAIVLWLGGAFNREIAEQIECAQSYVTRMLNLGAQRMGTTLKALRPLRQARPADPDRAPGYQKIADEVKALWWDELIPLGTVAKHLRVSTVTANAARAWWYESRGLKTPTYEEWRLEVERRVLEVFDAEELTIAQNLQKSPSGTRHGNADRESGV